MQIKKHRLSVDTPAVDAIVGTIWTTQARNGLNYYVQLNFDRKDKGGETVHCDVPKVPIDGRSNMGDTMKVAPRQDSCWDPVIICETCVAPTQGLALGLLMAAVVFGLIFSYVTRQVVRSQGKVIGP